jgi:hypothetical protein
MTATQLFNPSQHPPGFNMAETVARSVLRSQSPTVYSSNATTGSDATVIDLFSVPANTMIVDLIVNKSVIFDATTAANVVIGDSDDIDRFMAASDVDCNNLGWRSMKGAEGSNQVNSGGYIYTSAGVIQASVTPEDASNGTFIVYCIYSPYTSEYI